MERWSVLLWTASRWALGEGGVGGWGGGGGGEFRGIVEALCGGAGVVAGSGGHCCEALCGGGVPRCLEPCHLPDTFAG